MLLYSPMTSHAMQSGEGASNIAGRRSGSLRVCEINVIAPIAPASRVFLDSQPWNRCSGMAGRHTAVQAMAQQTSTDGLRGFAGALSPRFRAPHTHGFRSAATAVPIKGTP